MSQAQGLIQQALSLHQAGKLPEAQQLYRKILNITPQDPGIIHLLGLIAHQQGDHEQAIQLINKAISINPRAPEMYVNLGSALMALRRYAPAANALQKALALDAKLAEAHHNLIQALISLGRTGEAFSAAHTALQLAPTDPRFQTDLARVLREKGQLDQSLQLLTQVTRSAPNYAPAWCNLSDLLFKRSRPTESAQAAVNAIALSPTMAEAYTNLGNAQHAIGQHAEAVAAHRRALQLNPHNAIAHSNLLFGLHYDSTYSPHQIFKEHQAFDAQHAQPLRTAIASHNNSRDPNRKLRIGYVSPDFRAHAVANFFEPLLASHDRAKFFIACYSNSLVTDQVTRRIAAAADLFRDITPLDDPQAADLIRSDNIDLLVDLAGHTARNRLLCFARKPAPVQVTYLGYPDTTGLSTMDARFTDALADPPDADHYHTESLIRLPVPFLCYQPPSDAPAPSPPPHLVNGYITFGSFNNFTKVTTDVMQLWSKLLKTIPTARLLLKADALADPPLANSVLNFFAAQGITPDRITLFGFVPTIAGNLDHYRNIDIALDTFPYNGTTTTCEALLMGVPVITLAGQSHVSRVGVSLLTSMDQTDLIAENPDDYLDRAIVLAADSQRLLSLRSNLRSRLLCSPLSDARRLATHIEAAYRALFTKWCLT